MKTSQGVRRAILTVRATATAILGYAAVDTALVAAGHPLTQASQLAWLVVAALLAAWTLFMLWD